MVLPFVNRSFKLRFYKGKQKKPIKLTVDFVLSTKRFDEPLL